MGTESQLVTTLETKISRNHVLSNFTGFSGNDLKWLEMTGTDWTFLEKDIHWQYLDQMGRNDWTEMEWAVNGF